MTQTALLLQWYDENRRILPWREDPTPYHVWLSEIMLQQTRVEAVRGYYTRFLETLPDIRALADAPEDVYLKLWEGLGYYSRVRNLHKAAVSIMEDYDGQMPATAHALQKLPGIGAYTSAAIASIAFGESIPAVDGNLLRIFARMTGYAQDIKTPQAKQSAFDYYSAIMPPSMSLEGLPPQANQPGNFNQALMDLGATICLPKGQPLCMLCPWNNLCHAHANGQEQSLPVVPAKKPRKVLQKTVFVIYVGSEPYLLLHKRPNSGLLAGLYELPNAEGWLTEDEALTYLAELGLEDALILRTLPNAKHIFTHLEWQMTGYEIAAGHLDNLDYILASEEDMHKVYSIPSAFSAYTAPIQDTFARLRQVLPGSEV